MDNMPIAIRLIIFAALFVVVWFAVDWLAVTFVFHEAFEFSVAKHIVAPAVAGVVFCLLDQQRVKGKSGKN